MNPVCTHLFALLGFVLCFGSAGPLQAAEAENSDLPREAYQILKNRCYQCHGVTKKAPGLHILRHGILVGDRGERDRYVTPGDPDNSKLWLLVDTDDMPRGSTLSDQEKNVLKSWIEQGAKSWTKSRPFISNTAILTRIRDDLKENVNVEDRETQRYFTITHLHNNSAVTDNDLRLYRAAFSKAVNSLVGIDSRQARIVVPRAVDEEQTIFTLNLRDFGWDQDDRWKNVLAEYPYGLEPSDERGSRLHREIQREYQDFDLFAFIRADWFIAKATRPPLYHDLLGIPETIGGLEDKLGVDRQADFDDNRLVRGGVFQSGVSAQNRLVDWHPTRRGPSYWISYDFSKNSGRGNIARFPLGPKDIAGDDFEKSAFEHAGSEIIFSLPNGMLAYMLADADGNRIDVGPVDIVWDVNETSGTPQIVNGLSCMACHQHGVRMFDDKVREGHALINTDDQDKLRNLFSPSLTTLLEQDSQAFLNKLGQSVLTFLRQDEDADKEIENFEEPISTVVKLYDLDLGLEEVALELGLEDATALKNRLDNRALRQLGLAPLAGGGTLKRSMWDSRLEDAVSPYQEAARELDIGFPENAVRVAESEEDEKDDAADDAANTEDDSE